MTAKTHIGIAAHPDLNLQLKMKPLEFEFGGEASFALATGDIHLRFDEIPVTVAIPFLARRVQMGSIGPFGVHLRPLEAQFRAFGVNARGELGNENSETRVHASGNWRAEVEIAGQFPDQAFAVDIRNIVEE